MTTEISWADATWNPIIGCSKISAGCANCYAEKMAARLMWMEIARCEKSPDRPHKDWMKYSKVIHAGTSKWKGKTVFVESALTKPLHWRTPRKIFVCSMSDLFHESVPLEWIDRVLDVIEECQEHTFCILTKRPQIMTKYFNGLGKRYKLSCCPNLHLGVTVENQDNVGRIADLIQTPAAERFVSFEPLLERIRTALPLDDINYAFIGCESGPGARLCSLNDIRWLMAQCRNGGVKQHIKQIPLNGKCNKKILEWPEEFQIRKV